MDDKFLDQVSDEVDWGFLLLLECVKFRETRGMDPQRGHKVICAAVKQGEKPRAGVAPSNRVSAVVEESAEGLPWTLYVDIKMERGKKLRLFSCYPEAGRSMDAYEGSLALQESALPMDQALLRFRGRGLLRVHNYYDYGLDQKLIYDSDKMGENEEEKGEKPECIPRGRRITCQAGGAWFWG